MELLPPHLQDDKVAIATANPVVTGWVNPFKLKYVRNFGQMKFRELNVLSR